MTTKFNDVIEYNNNNYYYDMSVFKNLKCNLSYFSRNRECII